MYDSKIGRFLSIDPARQFYSPYIGMGNVPTIGVDPTGGECPKCPPGAKYDRYRENDQIFNYNPKVGVYTDLDAYAPNSSNWGWFQQLWYNLAYKFGEGRGGFTYMNSSGPSGEPIYEVGEGKASHIIEDPAAGLVVFKTPNKMLKLNTLKNLSKSDMKKLLDILSDGKYLIEFSNKIVRVSSSPGNSENIMNSVVEANNASKHRTKHISYSELWGTNDLKPRYAEGDEGVKLLDSVPDNSEGPDTIPVNDYKDIPGWDGLIDSYYGN